MATSNGHTREIKVGDRVSFAFGVKKDKSFYSFDQQAGRPAVVMIVNTLPLSCVKPTLSAFEQRTEDFKFSSADVLVIINAAGPYVLDYESAPDSPLEFIYCFPRIFEEWGWAGNEPQIVVMDRNARVIAPIRGGDPEQLARSALDCLAAPNGASEEYQQPAPILLIPNVFSAAFCGELISHFESNSHVKGGIASMDATGAAYNKIDSAKKKREDFILQPGDQLFPPVVEALSRVCLPEIQRAFQFNASYMDRILLARYDADGGCFLRHRDNAAPAVAYRQFAVSINLNMEEYEGGDLLFPEYNSCRYKAPTGSALIFSATLLHEATHVLKGSRYVLLTFFHNAEGEARRRAAEAPVTELRPVSATSSVRPRS